MGVIVSYFSVVRLRARAASSVEAAYATGRVREAVSTAWAWLDHRQVEEVIYKWGPQDLAAMQGLTKPQPRKIYLPHVALMVGIVLLYQTMVRRGGPFVSGPCPAAPNCSNFFVGALQRYGFWEACARSYLRVLNCDGTQPVSFTEDFRPGGG